MKNAIGPQVMHRFSIIKKIQTHLRPQLFKPETGTKNEEHNRIKLMIVIPTMSTGGMERCVKILLDYLNRRLFKLSLVTIFDYPFFYKLPKDVNFHILDRHKLSQAKTFQIKLLRHLRHKSLDIKTAYHTDLLWIETTAYKLGMLIREQQPNVVMAFDPCASSIVLFAKRYIPKSLKIIASLHIEFTKYRRLIDKGDLYTALIQHNFYEADGIFTISQGIADELIQNFNIQPELITFIPPPINLNQIRLLAQEPITEHELLNRDSPIVLFIGRLTSQKGLKYLIQATALARKQKRFRCVLIGEGDQLEDLKIMAQRLKISEDVQFIGKQDNIFKFMRHATCFVLPSLVEGTPMVILESMACGCPVIATDCSQGIRELLAKGNRGILVPPRDSRALAEAIIKIIQNKTLNKKLIHASLKYVEQFDVKKIIKRYEEFIKILSSVDK